MRSLRPALLSALLLVTVLPLPTRAAPGTTTEPTSSAAPTASSAAVVAAGSGTDLLTDITGYFVDGNAGAAFTPLEPVRLLDTRTGNGLTGKFKAGTPRSFAIAGRGGVPEDAVAVTINVTVTGQSSGGYVAVGPTVSATPTTSTLNLPRGENRANGATVALNDNGNLGAVWRGISGSTTHLVVDVTGYFADDGDATYTSLGPVRLVDTRTGNGLSGTFRSGTPRQVAIAGRGGVPDDATAVVINVTMVAPTSSGYVTVGPTVSSAPKTSTLNAPRNDTRANGTTVALDDQGDLAAVFKGSSTARTHLLIDVAGYYTAGDGGATFVPLAPRRFLDTRTGNGLRHLFASALPRTFQVAGRGEVPDDAVAVTGNVTMTDHTSKGYVSMGPNVPATPATSTLNTPLGDVRANNVTTALDGSGRLEAVFRGTRAPNYPSYDSRYHNEWELLVAIRDAEVANPDLVDVFPAGRSYQGRTIWAAKVSDNVAEDENEPEVLFDSLHHAREHLTIEQILDTFGQLTTRYDDSARIRNIVDKREVWFIFALNPDGWAHDLGGSPYRGWRKNRQPNSGSSNIGTDLNRNYELPLGLLRRLVRVDRRVELPRLGSVLDPRSEGHARLRRLARHQRQPADHRSHLVPHQRRADPVAVRLHVHQRPVRHAPG